MLIQPITETNWLCVIAPLASAAFAEARFGNIGLAAAAYNAGPERVAAWLSKHQPLPGKTRNYVAIITGWTADEWASPNPPKTSETTIKARRARGSPI